MKMIENEMNCFANTEKNIEEKRINEFIQCSEHVSLRESR